MKKITPSKKSMIQTTLIACVLLIASCDNNQKPKDTKVVAEEKNEAHFEKNNLEEDAEFLIDVSEMNMEAIQLGQMAQQKGSTAEIRELGKMMKDAHTKSQKSLTILASSKGISIPSSPTNDANDDYIKLNKKSGKDFDKSYADMVVDGHKDAIADFEKATTECKDTEIKNWAIASLPDLRTHLNHAIDCKNKCDKM
jgi:putative membrane protein